jgi:ParB-like chromosome segregation protein Spo0J
MPSHDGFGLPAPLSPETRALADLALYQPRFVWPPDFRATHEWRVLYEDVVAHGIRTPLRILRNGWVIDGTHRFLIAQELRLERVPVQVVPLALGRAPAELLSDVDRLRIERTAVREAIGRRHLTRHEVDVLFLALAEAQASVFGSAASRLARSRANLRAGTRSGPAPTGPTIEELARQYRTHPWRIRQLLALAEPTASEAREQFRVTRLPLRRAYESTRTREQDELDPVARYVARRIRILTEMMNCWASCTPCERELALDWLVGWLDRFRRYVEGLETEPVTGTTTTTESE